VHLSFVAAAALHAHLRPDQREDLPGTVAQLTGLKPDGRLARRIAADLASLTDHAPLLSLHVGLPAWQTVEERNAS
jgi:hypothetical protein